MRILITLLLFFLFFYEMEGFCQKALASGANVTIKIIEDETGKVIPAMVCITGKDGTQIRIPPAGQVVTEFSNTKDFYQGISFSNDRNWIGPIRKSNGMGNNEDRSFVYGLLPSLPYWRAPVLYQTTGDFSLVLPKGTWKVNVEHGNEFIPLEEEIKIEKKKPFLEKTIRLKRWIDLPSRGWYSGDVHVHHPTTKKEYQDYLLAYAQAEDVHLVNVLEMGHHLGTDFKQLGFGINFRINKDDFWLVSGQEEPRSHYGHILGLNINHLVRDTTVYEYYDLAFKNLHQQPGALVGFAHFSWNGCDLPRGFPWYITTGEIDFVELLQFAKINTLDYYDYLNLGFKITAAAGSDIPWGTTLGEVRTFVYTGQDFNADLWFTQFKEGHTFVSNGPALFLQADGQLPGTEIESLKGSHHAVQVKALSHANIGNITRVALFSNDGLVNERVVKEPVDSLSFALEWTIEESQWLAAVVYCENGAVAHTSPIYFVVDGKPSWSAEKAPAIIQKQLDAIDLIESEEKAKPDPDPEILNRLEKGQNFYQELIRAIKK